MLLDRKSTRLNSSHTLISYALRSEEHTSELQSHSHLVCRLLLEKKKKKKNTTPHTENRHAQLRQRRGMQSTPVLFNFFLITVRLPPIFTPFPSPFFFFLNDRAPPKFSPFPLPAPFPI